MYAFPAGVLALAYHLYQLGTEQEPTIQRRNENMKLPAVPLPSNPTQEQLAELDHRQVYVSGQLLHEREIRVVPRYFESQLGLHIITPIRRSDGSIVMINRGWVPASLKEPETRMEAQVREKVTILGHLVPGDEPFPFKVFSENPFLKVVNSPERNIWPRVDLNEMGDWVNSSPIMISALVHPPNPGGYPIGGQTDFQLSNTLLNQSYQYAGLAVCMIAAVAGGRYVHRMGIRLPWQKKPPSYTPFTI